MDVVVAFMTQQAIISNLMGILIGVGLVIALTLITRVLKKWNFKRGKLVVAAVFFFLILGRLVITTLA